MNEMVTDFLSPRDDIMFKLLFNDTKILSEFTQVVIMDNGDDINSLKVSVDEL